MIKKVISLLLLILLVVSIISIVPFNAVENDKIYLNADGKIYEVEAGSEYTYTYYLSYEKDTSNWDNCICGIDALVICDYSIFLDIPSFPLLGESLVCKSTTISDKNSTPVKHQLKFNYTNATGESFRAIDSKLITITIHIDDKAQPGMYYIATQIITLEGANEERIIFNGSDLSPEHINRREGVLENQTIIAKDEPKYQADENIVYPINSVQNAEIEITFDIDASIMITRFRDVYLDGTKLDYRNYSIKCVDDSLILCIKHEFLDSFLFDREYTLEIIFMDGETISTLAIVCTHINTTANDVDYQYYDWGYSFETVTICTFCNKELSREEHIIYDLAPDDPNYERSNLINFSNRSTNWTGPIQFYVYDPEAGYELLPWGSKRLNGIDNGDGTWSYNPEEHGMRLEEGKQYCIIFADATSGDQTYDLMFDTTCLGDTATPTGCSIENPVNHYHTAQEVRWKSSSLGPRLQVTSIGNVVGETCPDFTSKYDMLIDFLRYALDNARRYSEKDDQALLDDLATSLGLTSTEVSQAIKETNVHVHWKGNTIPDQFGYIVKSYYLTGSIKGDNSDITNVHKNLHFIENTDDMSLSNVRLSKGDRVKVALYNGGNVFTVYPDSIGREIAIDKSGWYNFFFKPYEIGNPNYWYITPSLVAESSSYQGGDVDNNGIIESVDTTYLLRSIAKIEIPYTSTELLRGDVDESGNIELTDVTAIQYYLANLSVPFPIGETID